MGVYSNKEKTRHFVQFQYKGKRVKKWLPLGTTVEQARAREARMLRTLENEGKGFVYFIEADHGKTFKIGFSLNPEKRLKTLISATGRLLKLRAVRPGSLELEKNLHFHFRQQRGFGEWFSTGHIERDLTRFQDWTEEVRKLDIEIWMAEQLGTRRRKLTAYKNVNTPNVRQNPEY